MLWVSKVVMSYWKLMFERVWKRDIFDSDSFNGKKWHIFVIGARPRCIFILKEESLFLRMYKGAVGVANAFNRSNKKQKKVAVGLVHFSGFGLERCCLCRVLAHQHKQHRTLFCPFLKFKKLHCILVWILWFCGQDATTQDFVGTTVWEV